MNDFNLRPEVTGFGSPIRTPKPIEPAPADQWKPHGKSFEVNGMGRLRTALALPASEAEIAASMRHADAAPVERPLWIGVDEGVNDQTAVFKPEWLMPIQAPAPSDALREMLAHVDETKRRIIGDFGAGSRLPELQALDRERNAIFKAMADVVAMQAMPPMFISTQVDKPATPEAMTQARAAMDAMPVDNRIVAGFDGCRCDGCNLSRGAGRFSSTEKIMADKPSLAPPAPTVGEVLRLELTPMIAKLAAKDGKYSVRETLREFGGDNLKAVPIFRLSELKARLQADLDIPF